ncbi:LytTR family DNA-binding domain-containing protein [Ancylobacter sp. TS-1]|uniref:LytR/AlgR family response regulator transcription factor n=1 Tax=Ancylobacter sp. TS-1 TaxID=1850374 RepID=UPI001265C3B2|nr:LytTR family DNA-binding domain-containing protein [Ancylobacter sp. TS-1]QFR33860.1 response regulator [Ancylobacter sp. TS-1]
MLRVLIADDEPLARRALRRLLEPHADVDCIGEADSLARTIDLVVRERPDLVLLDIEMNDGDGFKLFAAIPSPPRVIFVTAFAEYAVDAFEVEAVDYLLKPVAQARFDAALERARRLVPLPDRDGGMIELRAPARIVRARPADILAVRAEGDFSHVHFADQSPLMILRSIGQFEAELPAPPFLRLGRSIIVNCDRVRGLETRSRDETRLLLQGLAEPIGLGRAAAARLKQALAARRG